jgi:hypothetical protein
VVYDMFENCERIVLRGFDLRCLPVQSEPTPEKHWFIIEIHADEICRKERIGQPDGRGTPTWMNEGQGLQYLIPPLEPVCHCNTLRT